MTTSIQSWIQGWDSKYPRNSCRLYLNKNITILIASFFCMIYLFFNNIFQRCTGLFCPQKRMLLAVCRYIVPLPVAVDLRWINDSLMVSWMDQTGESEVNWAMLYGGWANNLNLVRLIVLTTWATVCWRTCNNIMTFDNCSWSLLPFADFQLSTSMSM